MKNYIVISIVFLSLLSACIRDPYIIEKLTEAEINNIPYQLNESIYMLDAYDSILEFKVITDCISEITGKLYDYENEEYTSYHLNQRCVEIHNDYFEHTIAFCILPNNLLNFKIDGYSYDLQINKAITVSDSIHHVLYKDVYTLILNRFSGADVYPLPVLIQYNKMYGLLYLEFNNGETLSFIKD